MDSPSSSTQLSTNQQPLLPDLKFLNLYDLENMSDVWKCNWNKFLIPQPPPSLFPFHNLTDIHLSSCPKIKYLLSPLMGKFLSNLKSVQIWDCKSIEVISNRDDEKATSTFISSHTIVTLFPHLETLWLLRLKSLKRIDELQSIKIKIENQTINNITEFDDEGSGSGGTTLMSPRLKGVTVVPQLSNLKDVRIYKCDLLPHVFTFSALESLKKLKDLRVRSCKTIQVIVKEEHGDQMTAPKVVVFRCLETLELRNLPNLKGFFLGKNHKFRWPLLDNVIIDDCPKMITFTYGQSETPKLKYMCTELGKHSLECGLNFNETTNQHDQTTFPSLDPTISEGTSAWSYHNLIEIKLTDPYRGDKKIIPSNALLQVQKLEKIHLVDLVEEVVFEVVEKTVTDSDSQTVVKIPNLREVHLKVLRHLKYLWKSNQGMVLVFPNLTSVLIDDCKSLEHVFTCSMIGSLMQLKDLGIISCKNIKVIVKKEEEEVCDAKVNDIKKLPRLKCLQLKNLKSLKGFCLGKEAFLLPSFDTLEIEKCPAITIFTKGHIDTPELKEIDTSFGTCDVSEEDLNSFIKTKQQEGYHF